MVRGASSPAICQGPHEQRMAIRMIGDVTHVRHMFAMPILLSLTAASEQMSRPRESADAMTGIRGGNPLLSPRKRNINDMATHIGESAAGRRNPVPSCLNLCLRQLGHESGILTSLLVRAARLRFVRFTLSSSSSFLLALDQTGPAGGVHHVGSPVRKWPAGLP